MAGRALCQFDSKIIADGCSVVLAGGPDDTAKGEKITELAGQPMQLVNLIGRRVCAN